MATSTERPFYYYEVYIVRGGQRCSVGVGFAPSTHPRDQQPGWTTASLGYHGDDGNAFVFGEHDAFGPTFQTGDVIGCGFDAVFQRVFYTKNGSLVGWLEAEITADLVPTVGLAAPGQQVYINVGQQPFLFDLDFENTLSYVQGWHCVQCCLHCVCCSSLVFGCPCVGSALVFSCGCLPLGSSPSVYVALLLRPGSSGLGVLFSHAHVARCIVLLFCAFHNVQHPKHKQQQ
jgi:SPRY domain